MFNESTHLTFSQTISPFQFLTFKRFFSWCPQLLYLLTFSFPVLNHFLTFFFPSLKHFLSLISFYPQSLSQFTILSFLNQFPSSPFSLPSITFYPDPFFFPALNPFLSWTFSLPSITFLPDLYLLTLSFISVLNRYLSSTISFVSLTPFSSLSPLFHLLFSLSCPQAVSLYSLLPAVTFSPDLPFPPQDLSSRWSWCRGRTWHHGHSASNLASLPGDSLNSWAAGMCPAPRTCWAA